MRWLLFVLIALTYHVLGQISFLTALPDSPAGPALAWLPTGFAVGAVLLYGYGVWPAIALGSLMNGNFSVLPALTIAGFIAANTVDPLAAVWVSRKVVGREIDFYRPRDLIRFILVVIFVSSPLSATIGATSLHMTQNLPNLGYEVTWFTWWISDALSVLVLTPLMLAWGGKINGIGNYGSILEKVLTSVAGFGVLYLIFSTPLGRDTIHFVYWVFPFIIWFAFRHGFRATTASVFVLAVVTIAATSQGVGPFVGKSVDLSYLFVQSFLMISAITALIVASLVNERDRAIQNRDEFFMVASHELSTPLTVLGMLSKFLNRLVAKEELDSMTWTQRAELVKMNSRETQRLSKLVEDLLEGSRISAGKLTLELGETDITEIVKDVVKEFAEQAEQAGVTIHLDAKESVVGNWDERRLFFVVRTLIANALKFGEGKPVFVSVKRNENRAIVAVEDQGIGIARESFERIFERFTRLKSVTSYGGLGQGLFISSAVVRGHGGRVRVESEPGRGSRFIVELPGVQN